MDNFYWIVLAISLIIMIVILVASGMMLQHQNSKTSFPATYTKCPDNWKYSDANGCEAKTIAHDSNNKGKTHTYTTAPDIASAITSNGTNSSATDMNVKFNNDAKRCDLQLWANHHGIKWDGVTNYNNC